MVAGLFINDGTETGRSGAASGQWCGQAGSEPLSKKLLEGRAPTNRKRFIPCIEPIVTYITGGITHLLM